MQLKPLGKTEFFLFFVWKKELSKKKAPESIPTEVEARKEQRMQNYPRKVKRLLRKEIVLPKGLKGARTVQL